MTAAGVAGLRLGGLVRASTSTLRPSLEQGPWRANPDRDRLALTDINTDLFPKDEYSVGAAP